jgi:hypothetical protein
MTTKHIDRRPCPHALQEAGNRHTGDCYACGASAVQVIKDLHARIRRLEEQLYSDQGGHAY